MKHHFPHHFPFHSFEDNSIPFFCPHMHHVRLNHKNLPCYIYSIQRQVRVRNIRCDKKNCIEAEKVIIEE